MFQLSTRQEESEMNATTVAVDLAKSWALAVQARTNHNKAACALANKLARIAWAVWVKQENYRPARVASRSTEALST